MEIYQNLGGNSSVSGYEIANESIAVYFKDGTAYLYNYQITGTDNVEQMKTLAIEGIGLNSFIMRHVRKAYAAKLR